MIKEFRQMKGLSQRDLSNLTGISIRTLQSYEQGARDLNKANIETLLALSKALDCKIEDLLKK